MLNGYKFDSYYATEPDKKEKEELVKESLDKIMKIDIAVNRKDKDLREIIEDAINDPELDTVVIKMKGDTVHIKIKMKWIE